MVCKAVLLEQIGQVAKVAVNESDVRKGAETGAGERERSGVLIDGEVMSNWEMGEEVGCVTACTDS